MVVDVLYHVWFVICMLLILTGCGSKEEVKKASNKFEEVKPLIAIHCSNCHNGEKLQAFNTEERWLTSKAKTRIENNSMPPNKPLDPKDKEKLLASFN